MTRHNAHLTAALLLALPLLLVIAAFTPFSCMQIAEKDNLVIAEVDNENITRGDLFRILRNMEDTERPEIATKSDLLRVLNQIIDERISIPLGEQLGKEGKINVPREAARERYFQSKGDDAEELRYIYNLNEKEAKTELMEVYDLTPEIIRARKDVIEIKTDIILEKMQGRQAVAYLAMQDFQAGTLQPDEAAVQREYDLRKNEFINYEWMSFRAFRFPSAIPEAPELAAKVRGRLDAGEPWDQLESEYLALNPDFVIESEIENNPTLQRFRSFWEHASGAQAPSVLGPLYLPAYQVMAQDAQGRPQPVQMPDSYIVLKVLESRPERVKTLDEAKPLIVPEVLITQEMEKMRQEHGVKIYEDNLFDPAQFGSREGALRY
ncbi:MAG: hypothetical protein HYZ00_02260 [Candidatus Hydrogenedentes bacterium]|nr:hypothetical protein [Candidatus Hydrogenedentota bacterium]